MTWLVRLLIALLLLRLLWRFLAGVIRGLTEPQGRTPAGQSVQLVRDPVCGTFVVPSRALPLSRGRETHYFCSERCREQFATKP